MPLDTLNRYFYLMWLFLITTTYATAQNYSPGIVAYRSYKFDEAKKLLSEEIKIFEESNNQDTLARLYEYLQFCYTFSKQADSANIILNQGSQFALQRNFLDLYSRLEINKAENAFMQNKMSVSQSIYKNLVDSFDIPNHYKVDAYSRLASIATTLSDSVTAFKNIQLAIEHIDTTDY